LGRKNIRMLQLVHQYSLKNVELYSCA